MTVQTEVTEPPSGAVPTDEKGVDLPERLPRESLVVVALLMAAAFTVILNETTMGVALTPIMDDLGITATTGQWLTTAFMLTMSVVIPATGFLINRLGTRGAYLLGMSVFSAGTLTALLAPGFGVLVTGRVIQATGTAIMMPLLMTTIMTIVPPNLRGRVMGNITLVIAVAPAMGPTISGAVSDTLGWRAVFGVMLPVALVTLGAGILWIRNVGEKDEHPLDPVSLVLALFGFGGLVFGLSELGETVRSHGSPVGPVVALVVGVASLGLFVLRQLARQRTDSALLDLRVFLDRNFRLAVGILALSMLAMFGAFILLPLLLQESLGLEPLQAGLLLLPGGLAMGLLGPVLGRVYDKVGPRPIMIPAVTLVTLAIVGFSFVTPATSPYFVMAAHVVMSIGLCGVFTPMFTAAMAELAPHLYSHASATINTVQQVAGAAGTALFVALMTVGAATLAPAGASEAVSLTVGSRLAFLVGAGVLLVAIVLTTMIRRPRVTGPGGFGH